MLITYVIDNTSGMLNFQIAPGELNGPGGVEHLTDLRLYGNGALRWGEGVDENFLRLMESFSCPAKQNTDKWFDGTNYDPRIHRLWPKGEEDGDISDEFQNGPGRGINRPITGQIWFNTSDRRTYIYDHSKKQNETVSKWAPDGIGSWTSVSGGTFPGNKPPSNPSTGDLWYDTSGIICAQPQLFVYFPTHPEALPLNHPVAPGWVSASENYVKQCGDYMSGILNMGGKAGNNKNKIINIGDIASPTHPTQPHPTEANTALNVRSGDTRYVNVTGDNMTGNLNMSRKKIINIGDISNPTHPSTPHPTEANTVLNVNSGDARYIKKFGDNMTGDIDMKGHFITGLGCRKPPRNTDAMSRDCSDQRYVQKSGDSMIGWLDLKNSIPNENSDYRAVPVKMLRDYVQKAVGPFGKGAIFYGYYSYQSAQTGKATIEFDFDSWRKEYNSSTGQNVSPAQFLVVCIPTFESFRVSNATPLLSGETAGTLGDYGFVDYNAGPEGSYYPYPNNFQFLRILAGPTGYAATIWKKSPEIAKNRARTYSCQGVSRIGFHFFGGPINVLWKKRDPKRT